MKKLKWRIIDNSNPDSISVTFRRRRFCFFLRKAEYISTRLNRPLQILDIGGTIKFWEMMNATTLSHTITLLNLTPMETQYPNIKCVVGDARDMSCFYDKQFDIAFSNSVIEHLGSFSEQLRMAKEVQRVATYYCIQTPSYYFPLEPHFFFPFFHWLPRSIRLWLIMHFNLGWFTKQKRYEDAAKIVDEINLLKYSDLKKLFPDAKIVRERIWGFTKSYIAMNI